MTFKLRHLLLYGDLYRVSGTLIEFRKYSKIAVKTIEVKTILADHYGDGLTHCDVLLSIQKIRWEQRYFQKWNTSANRLGDTYLNILLYKLSFYHFNYNLYQDNVN